MFGGCLDVSQSASLQLACYSICFHVWVLLVEANDSIAFAGGLTIFAFRAWLVKVRIITVWSLTVVRSAARLALHILVTFALRGLSRHAHNMLAASVDLRVWLRGRL